MLEYIWKRTITDIARLSPEINANPSSPFSRDSRDRFRRSYRTRTRAANSLPFRFKYVLQIKLLTTGHS